MNDILTTTKVQIWWISYANACENEGRRVRYSFWGSRTEAYRKGFIGSPWLVVKFRNPTSSGSTGHNEG